MPNLLDNSMFDSPGSDSTICSYRGAKTLVELKGVLSISMERALKMLKKKTNSVPM